MDFSFGWGDFVKRNRIWRLCLCLLLLLAALAGCAEPEPEWKPVRSAVQTERRAEASEETAFATNTEPSQTAAAETGDPASPAAQPSATEAASVIFSAESSEPGSEQTEATAETLERTVTEPETELSSETATGEPTVNYIANTKTKKFHYPDCSSVSDMKESNKWYFTGTRDELIEQGYQPCKRCNP